MDFKIAPGFCNKCGTLMPSLEKMDNVKCILCRSEIPSEALSAIESSYEVHFNERDAYSSTKKVSHAGGPVITRKCPKCKNNKMSFATLQLRSADEGQTVFYTCTKCKFNEIENS